MIPVWIPDVERRQHVSRGCNTDMTYAKSLSALLPTPIKCSALRLDEGGRGTQQSRRSEVDGVPLSLDRLDPADKVCLR